MYRNLRWKILTIVTVVVLFSALGIYPIAAEQYGWRWPGWLVAKHVKLGLDLKGGVHMVLRVQTDDAIKAETETAAEQFREALKNAGIAITAVRPTSLTSFVVEGVPPANDAQVRQLYDQQLAEPFDRETGVGGTYTFRMRPNVQARNRQQAVEQALQTVERRVNEFGVAEPVVAPYGTSGDQIVVQLPGVADVTRAKELIRNVARLELKLVEAGPASDQQTLLQAHTGQVPPDMEVVPGPSATPGDVSPTFYLVRRVAAITGNDLRSAKTTIDEFNTPAVGFTLNSQGVAKFTRVTGDNIGRQLAIILDGRVVSAPVIEGRIAQPEARITGSFTQEEAADLALVLRSGALPASLTYQEERTVGPTLGHDSIRAGVIASLVGLGLVAAFMLFYYRAAGINAILSVALNLVILLGFMAYVEAVMTLPGIAGFILTIGIGVDSNVLIFERIREELATKKGVRQAVAAGFDRVFLTILDTHIASLISAAFLFQFGTGPIRGFATTLFFGLLSNVFTAVFVSRTLFEFILSRRPAGEARLSI